MPPRHANLERLFSLRSGYDCQAQGAQEIEVRAAPRWLAMMLPSFIS
jgi:hypothetical protein